MTRGSLRAAISNAYYENRGKGQTMETAADAATDAVCEVLAAARADIDVERLRTALAGLVDVPQFDANNRCKWDRCEAGWHFKTCPWEAAYTALAYREADRGG